MDFIFQTVRMSSVLSPLVKSISLLSLYKDNEDIFFSDECLSQKGLCGISSSLSEELQADHSLKEYKQLAAFHARGFF